MYALRAAVRPIARSTTAALSRRAYADVADGKLALSLVLPHQSLYSAQGVVQVNIPAATGDMGILANHVPSVEALRAGVVEVVEDAAQASKKWFGEFGHHGKEEGTFRPESKLRGSTAVSWRSDLGCRAIRRCGAIYGGAGEGGTKRR